MKHKIKNMFLENGILNGKRVLATVTTLTLLAGTTLSALASGDGIRSDGTPWLSTGDVSYQNANGNQSSLFAREDLDYLDDRITDLENTTNNGKAEVASAINSYGYHKDSAVDSNASYSDLASAIKTSQQIPTDHTFAGVKPGETDETSGTISAATADNLSLGTAAWVDGELIVGTGADNNSYYSKGELSYIKFNDRNTTITIKIQKNGDGIISTSTGTSCRNISINGEAIQADNLESFQADSGYSGLASMIFVLHNLKKGDVLTFNNDNQYGGFFIM